ncbi:MAG: tyrosine-type recombinase/integrase [Candidatus Sulfotelmatobacter sp.]
MMSAPSMQSRVEDYLDDRRRLGFSLKTTGSYLMSLAHYADRSGHSGPLSSEIIVAWAQNETASDKPTTWAKRLSSIRGFLNYCAQTDGQSNVPDSNVFGRPRGRPTPHIYTETEIADLLAAAKRLPEPGTLRPATYETFFGLLAATGLRLSEALHLRCADVDLTASQVTVRQAKWGKSRLVPLHPTVCEAMSRYQALRQRVPSGPDSHFFVSESGGAISRSVPQKVFERLRADLGWVSRGSCPAPRIHDLRHSFICRRVMLWHQHGTDIDNAMLALSTYVGHVAVTYTYWYLTGVPELMAVAGQKFERFASEAEEASND